MQLWYSGFMFSDACRKCMISEINQYIPQRTLFILLIGMLWNCSQGPFFQIILAKMSYYQQILIINFSG